MSSYGLWLSAAGMQVSEHQQTLLANNLANGQTTGFKHDLAVVQQRLVESRENPDTLGFAHPVIDNAPGGLATRPSHISFEQGAIEITGRPLDWAVDGDGFFTVGDGQETRYTRDGVFSINATGEIVLSSGGGRWRLLDSSGSVMTVDPAQAHPKVSASGVVRQGDNIIGEVALVTHADKQKLRKNGENLFVNTEGEMVPAGGVIVGKSREHSTFDMMRGLASMIQATRAYEMNARLLQLQDEMTNQALQRVGRVA